MIPNKKFKAIIRVVKSLSDSYNSFDTVTVVREPIIEAKDKNEVKQIMLEKYPQFFQNGKIYERETKDPAQFFYILIYPLYEYEIRLINEGEWKCSYCGQVYENKYVEIPKYNTRLFGNEIMFCGLDSNCMDNYKAEKYKNIEFPDNDLYIKSDSPHYIYRITEKATGKCYVGKTRNAPFFRWWDHLTKSNSPFGLHLRKCKLSDWTFEVLEELPFETPDKEVLRIESEYIVKFNSIENGYNSVISNKAAEPVIDIPNLFS